MANKAKNWPEVPTTAKAKKQPPCSQGCNDAEFRLINGEEQTLLCRPSFSEQLLDLVVSNDDIAFTRDAEYDDVPTFKVVG